MWGHFVLEGVLLVIAVVMVGLNDHLNWKIKGMRGDIAYLQEHIGELREEFKQRRERFQEGLKYLWLELEDVGNQLNMLCESESISKEALLKAAEDDASEQDSSDEPFYSDL